MRWLIPLLTIVPLVELVLLLVLSDYTSWQFTLGFIVLTGVLGALVLRYEGLRCWRRFRDQLAAGELPAEPLLDGIMILAAGMLLVTPGVLTDLAGLLLLLPPVRRLLKRSVRRRLEIRMDFYTLRSARGGSPEPPARSRVIDTPSTEVPPAEADP